MVHLTLLLCFVWQKYKVPAPHPEMEGVKYGEELLVFKAKEEDNIE